MPGDTISNLRQTTRPELSAVLETRRSGRAVHTLLSYVLLLVVAELCILPKAKALPSFARQTGQRCAACHVGGNWPQLTPWGRFFKLAGYTAGKSSVDKEGFHYVPIGLFGQAGLTWAAQPKDARRVTRSYP